MSKNSKRKKRQQRAKRQARVARRTARKAVGMIVIRDKLSVKQIADDAGVSTTTVYKWLNEGPERDRLPSDNVTGKKSTRVRFEDWQRFKTERRIAGRDGSTRGVPA